MGKDDDQQTISTSYRVINGETRKQPFILPGGFGRLGTLSLSMVVVRLIWTALHPIVVYGVKALWP